MGSDKWLDAHFDPVSSLYTFSQCIALSDINADGDWKLIIADLGTGSYEMKLKVYKGTNLVTENTIIDLPTAVVTFYMDLNEPRTPAIAVASGPNIYVYKNLRPYFKFTLPSLEINQTEEELWHACRDGRLGIGALREELDNLRASGTTLTVRSLRLLNLQAADAESFVNAHKAAPLKRQTVVSCMATMKKSMADDDAISCLILGTENSQIYCLDPEAFTIMSVMNLPSVAVFLSVTGLFDVEFTVIVSCRNGGVYILKRGQTEGKLLFKLISQPVGLQRLGKNILVGCMDETLCCYSSKGHRQWSVKMAASVTCLELMEHKNKGIQAVLVALSNSEVHVYKDKFLVDIIRTEDVVTSMRFGRFGREESSLIMITKGGALIVKMLKRTAQFDDKVAMGGIPSSQYQKLDIPKKTRLFLDQTMRERENAVDMHRQFQHDLYRMRLDVARNYVNVLKNSLTPVSVDQSEPLKLQAHVQGIGPTFKMNINLQNASLTQPCIDLFISFDYDSNLYSIQKPMINVPMLVPGLNYVFETFVECLSTRGISDLIKVFVLKKNSCTPIITAVINMPISEPNIVA